MRNKNGKLFRYATPSVIPLLIATAMAALMALPTSAPASAYDDSVGIQCNRNPVREGDSFRIYIEGHYDASDFWKHGETPETMKVYWPTSNGSADESDYVPLSHEGQASNASQTASGKMGRTFHTKEDSYPEPIEGFWVEAVNAGNDENVQSCSVDIEDDDGPGVIKTRIASNPKDYIVRETPSGRIVLMLDHPTDKYLKDETILINQEFSEPVTVHGNVSIGIHLGEGENQVRRSAIYREGSGTHTLTYGYRVTAGDLDRDGIEIPNSDFGEEGAILTAAGESINPLYFGLSGGKNQKVHAPAVEVTSISVVSNPATGDIYRYGENIDVQVTFEGEVEVQGRVTIDLHIREYGAGTVKAKYLEGSGSRNLVFRHRVTAEDYDPDGLSITDGGIGAQGRRTGFGGTGSIRNGGNKVSIHYGGLENLPAHWVDGRPYATGIAVTSTPPNGSRYRIGDRIEFTVNFDQNVNVFQRPAFTFMMGDDMNADAKTARYDSGSGTRSLVFDYTVREMDRDDDGISVASGRTFLANVGTITETSSGVEANPAIPEMPDQRGHAVYGFLSPVP